MSIGLRRCVCRENNVISGNEVCQVLQVVYDDADVQWVVV
jgi:hypothetical protein